MRRLTFLSLVPLLLALVVAVTACGGSDDAEQADATVPRATQPRTQEQLAVTTPTVTATTPVPAATTPQQSATNPQARQTTPSQQAAPGAQTGGAQPRDPAASQRSGGAVAPVACGDVANGFLSGVQATGAGCGEATAVASAWLDAVGESGPEAAVQAAGYACTGSRAGDRTAVTCIADGGGRVTFDANN